MAGDVIRDLAERRPELSLQQAVLPAQHEVLERIEHRIAHREGIGVPRVHERQLLLEHQRAGGHRRKNRIAFLRHPSEHRDVDLLQSVYSLKIPKLELGHAAAGFLLHHHVRNPVVLEQREQVVAHPRLVVVHVAGGKDRRLARGMFAVLHRERRAGCKMRSELPARVGRQFAVLMYSESRLKNGSYKAVLVGCIDGLRHHRDRGELAERVGGGQQPVAQPDAFAELDRFRAQHQVGEVDVPGVRRHVRALRHVAHVAQVALLDDLPVVLLCNAVDLHGRGGVHQVEQGREGGAQVHAPPAAVADVEDAPELLLDLRLVVELGVLPVEPMPGRSLERTLAHQSLSESRAFWKRLAWLRSALASVSNQSAISPKPSSRACFAMPGYMSVYSWVSPATAAFRLSRVRPIGRLVAGSPTASRYSRCPCACPVSPSAVERNSAETSFWPSTSALAAKYR